MNSPGQSGTVERDDTEQVSFRCPRDLYEALERRARENDRTVSAEVRRAVRLHLLHVAGDLR